MTGSNIPKFSDRTPPTGEPDGDRQDPAGPPPEWFDPDEAWPDRDRGPDPPPPRARRNGLAMAISALFAALAGAATVYGFSSLPGENADALWLYAHIAIAGLALLIPAGLALAHFAIAWSEGGARTRHGWGMRATALIVLTAFAAPRALQIPTLQLAWQTVTGTVIVAGARVESRGSDALALVGPFEDPALAGRLAIALRDRSATETLVLSSTGGLLSVASDVARLVQAADLSTRVEGWCLSACTMVFLAGDRPVLAAGGRLGFHRPSLGADFDGDRRFDYGFELPDSDPAVAWMRQGLAAAGAAPWFVDKAMSTRHTDMWYPTRDELARSGLLIIFE